MFTIKYRYYRPANITGTAPLEPNNFDECEQVYGPYTFVSQEMEDGYRTVYAYPPDPLAAHMTFGPITPSELKQTQTYGDPPRPTLWVMNEHGATVAKYDL